LAIFDQVVERVSPPARHKVGHIDFTDGAVGDDLDYCPRQRLKVFAGPVNLECFLVVNLVLRLISQDIDDGVVVPLSGSQVIDLQLSVHNLLELGQPSADGRRFQGLFVLAIAPVALVVPVMQLR
jgi:hypothetical protein